MKKLGITVAGWGWALLGDIWMIIIATVGLALAGAPLIAWDVLTRRLYHDVVVHLPLLLVLGTLAVAGALSGYILYRLYRFLLHCRVC